VNAWNRFWFNEIPPHVYALLRILFGVLGLLALLAVSDVTTFWAPDGLVPGAGQDSWRSKLPGGIGGYVFGAALLSALLASHVAMIVGYRSRVAVTLCFFANLVQSQWNGLPLSGAHQVTRMVLFGLLWADTGAVWSVDARRRDGSTPTAPIWPLRLIQFQIAIVYLSTGIWKVANTDWQTGTALLSVLNHNAFRRFPGGLPASMEPLAIVGTYVTVIWELAFPVLLVNRITRRLVLALGVAMHLGMWLTLEIGPFSPVMLASYCAFLDPNRVAAFAWRPARARVESEPPGEPASV
jgi:hypothetical protein